MSNTLTPAQFSDIDNQITQTILPLQAQIANPTGYTRTQVAAARLAVTYLQNMRQQVSGMVVSVTGTQYIVRTGDTIFSVAQAQLGDVRRYKDLMSANGLTSYGLTPGQQLIIPT